MDTPNPPVPAEEPTIDAPARIAGAGYCPRCDYDLNSLAPIGTCPECSEAYHPDTLRRRPRLSAIALIFRFGWPLMILALWAPAEAYRSSGDPYGILGVMMLTMICLLVSVVNALIQVVLLRRHASQRVREGSFFRSMGTLATVMFIISGMLPGLVVGGCVLMLLGAGWMS